MSDFIVNTEEDFSQLIEREKFDYIDFGCSKGGSLLLGKEAFGGIKGLGIDRDSEKVELTRKAGYHAVKFDINAIPDTKLVRFVIMSHFLEHVPDLADVAAFIEKACAISTDFVYIQQPYFDADAYLARHGLKLFWSDWRGHQNRMTSLEFWILLRNMVAAGWDFEYSIVFRHHIIDSSDSRVHSILSPIDQFEYQEGVHPPKGSVISFSEPVFAETRVLITMPGVDHAAMLKKVKNDCVFIGSDGVIPLNAFHEKKRSR